MPSEWKCPIDSKRGMPRGWEGQDQGESFRGGAIHGSEQ